jgi:CheY-like chemotaxis protein
MANRTLLCVEPDEGAVAVIRGVLEPYGFKVESIPNGEQAIEWARGHDTALIIVCVEPRKVGYALCNKIKRSPELQRIPLILTSAEETLQTFEQHKKLKSRADEYILKPLRRDDLIGKVGSLVELGEPNSASSDDILLSADLSEEISVADADIVEEDGHGGGAAFDGVGRAPPRPPRESPFGAVSPDVDPMFDQETDAAFAAIQTGGDNTAPLSADAPDLATPPPTTGDWSGDRSRSSSEFSLPSSPAGESASMAPLFDDAGDVPPSPDEVNAAPTFQHDAAMEARVADLTGRIQLMEEERKRLLGEIDELKLRLQSQPLSKEKEVLSLREIINRKEKDILDLRDALDARDRQGLDQKDRMREHERARRDLEEKMLAMEKGLMVAQERTAALAHDKEKSSERERGMKARLDDALNEIQKAHDEADALKKRLAQAEDRARSELDRLRGQLEGRITELEEGHRTELARLSDERAQAEEAAKSAHDAEFSRLRSTHAGDLESLQKRATEEQNALNERLQGELSRLRKDHEQALAAGKEEQAVQLAAERQAHQTAIEAKEKDLKNEILGLRRRHEEELGAAEEKRQKELADAEARRVADLEAAENRRRTELQAREGELHAQLAEMDRRHFGEKTELGERHRQELDQAHARTARTEGELAARTEELSEKQRRLAGVEADLDATRADFRDREVKLGQMRDRAAELEAKAAEYEEQILRAFQKLRADDRLVDKAKRALAVALSLLDERGAAPATTPGPTAAQPAAAGASQPPPVPRPTEESTT